MIDAGLVLANVEGGSYGSQPMKVPNVYLGVESTHDIDLTRIFSDIVEVSCEVENKAVAEVSYTNSALSVKGLAVGATKANVTVTKSSVKSVSQTFVITVRNGSGNGWM